MAKQSPRDGGRSPDVPTQEDGVPMSAVWLLVIMAYTTGYYLGLAAGQATPAACSPSPEPHVQQPRVPTATSEVPRPVPTNAGNLERGGGRWHSTRERHGLDSALTPIQPLSLSDAVASGFTPCARCNCSGSGRR